MARTVRNLLYYKPRSISGWPSKKSPDLVSSDLVPQIDLDLACLLSLFSGIDRDGGGGGADSTYDFQPHLGFSLSSALKLAHVFFHPPP